MKFSILRMTMFGSLAWATILPAASQVTQYTDRAQFIAASAPLSGYTFNSVPAGTVASGTNFGQFSVTTSSAAVSLQVSTNAAYQIDGTNFLYASIPATTPASGVTFTFGTGVTSFGLDVSSFNNASIRTFVSINGSTFNPGAATFLGYTSSTAFQSVTFFVDPSNGNDAIGMDNILFAAAPEPRSTALMIGGFGVIGAAARRRRRAALAA